MKTKEICSYKILQSFFNVQDGLDPGRDDGDRSSAEFGQIRADIETRFGASVNAADPAGHENRNSGLKSEGFFTTSLLPGIPCKIFLASHFCTDWLSRLGLGHQAGSATDQL